MHDNNGFKEQVYRTGSTSPKTSRRGLLSVVLVAAIFLGGLFSILSLLNIHLFRSLTQDAGIAPASVRFSQSTTEQSQVGYPTLGVSVQQISGFEKSFFRIPQGLYITQVSAGSAADTAGILPGDILLFLGDSRITGDDSLQQQLAAYSSGKTVVLRLSRKGTEYSVILTLDKEPE